MSSPKETITVYQIQPLGDDGMEVTCDDADSLASAVEYFEEAAVHVTEMAREEYESIPATSYAYEVFQATK